MTQYNPRYDTKVQPFNISIIKGWIRKKDLKELQQWLDEGEPHKRLLKESIYNATIDQWLDGIKILFEKDWVSLETKLKEVIDKIHFCKKDDVWVFIRDIVFADKKLIKKFSFPLFWAAKNNNKESLFDEDKVDFSHEDAEITMHYQYISKQEDDLFSSNREKKEKNIRPFTENDEKILDYLLSKPIYIKPFFFIEHLNNNRCDYLISLLKKRGDNPLFENKIELFVVACETGIYFQSMINNLKYCGKGEEEINLIKEQQNFMLKLFLHQNVDFEFDFTDKILEKNKGINYKLEKSFGDFAPYDHRKNNYGSLGLKYIKSDSVKKNELPKSQVVKLAWYWIGGKKLKERERITEKYLMTEEDKKYAEIEFEKLLNV